MRAEKNCHIRLNDDLLRSTGVKQAAEDERAEWFRRDAVRLSIRGRIADRATAIEVECIQVTGPAWKAPWASALAALLEPAKEPPMLTVTQ